MTLKSSSRKRFRHMFLRSLPVSSIVPAIFLIERLLGSFSHSIYDYNKELLGFFWDDAYYSIFFGSVGYIFFASLLAVVLFEFAWRKKECNVIFSLGMKRSDIYLAKILAGIVPFAVAIVIAGAVEIFACAACGYRITARYLVFALRMMAGTLATYVMSFCVSAIGFANTGSIFEGTVSTVLFITLPNTLSNLLEKLYHGYTLGALTYFDADEVTWNWNDPLWAAEEMQTFVQSSTEYGILSVHNTLKLNIFDWSSTIMCFVYASIAVGVGIFFFNRRRNEIAGTFGRSREINSAAAFVFALFSFNFFFDANWGASYFPAEEATVLTFAIACIAFFIAHTLYKLIFGHKRKKEFILSLKKMPVYIGSLGVCALVFFFGLFGYSSRIPDIEDIKSVEVSTPMFAYLDDALADSSYHTMKYMNIRNEITPNMTYNDAFEFYLNEDRFSYNSYPESDLNNYSTQTAYFKTQEDIEKAIGVHQAFIDSGHIRKNSEDTCGTKIRFTYHLKDGRTITRDYHRANEETTRKILLLSDCNAVKDIQNLFLLTDPTIYANEQEYFGKIGEMEIHKFAFLYKKPCYIFRKDMSRGYPIGIAPDALIDALITDIAAQSANEYFCHSPEDEIGVISFGLSEQGRFLVSNDSETNDFHYYDLETATWNLNSTDVKAFVITKDMVNTLKYLEENDLIKYFVKERTAEEISYIKISPMSKLYMNKNKQMNIPVFYGSYSRRKPVYSWTETSGTDNSEYYLESTVIYEYSEINLFNRIEPITDKNRIQALLDDSLIFGYCSNDCCIMQIVYTDNSVRTVLVPADSDSLQGLV